MRNIRFNQAGELIRESLDTNINEVNNIMKYNTPEDFEQVNSFSKVVDYLQNVSDNVERDRLKIGNHVADDLIKIIDSLRVENNPIFSDEKKEDATQTIKETLNRYNHSHRRKHIFWLKTHRNNIVVL